MLCCSLAFGSDVVKVGGGGENPPPEFSSVENDWPCVLQEADAIVISAWPGPEASSKIGRLHAGKEAGASRAPK